MAAVSPKRTWALTVAPGYRKDTNRLPPKFQNQVSRKTQDLMYDPTPGGSRTALTQYDGLYRLRAGEFRVIYAYDDRVVQLLSLRRRDEDTYDDLDHLEIEQFEEFRKTAGNNVSHRIPEWEELAKQWAAPVAKGPEPLPAKITKGMLEELLVPVAYRDALLAVDSVEALLSCDAAPAEICERVLERVSPRQNSAEPGPLLPIVVRGDLIDDAAATVSGPIDVSEESGPSGLHSRVGAGTSPLPLVLVTSRRQEPMAPYRGNSAKAIGKDSKYTVKLDGTVQLTYTVSSNERALLTTDGHDELVTMVNDAKKKSGSAQGGGAFLINEYRHVLVPTLAGDKTLFAGVYTRDLEFKFEGLRISPVARSGTKPGEVWPGPHVGIRYTLAAGATDIRYEVETQRQSLKRVSLTDYHSVESLSDLLKMCRDVKPKGGAIYINEARELFTPVDGDDGYERVYIGHLGNKPWFPEPD